MLLQAAVGDLTIAYRAAGRVDRPPLVLLHGRTASHRDWDGVVDQLAERYSVYAPDLRGHGASSWPGDYELPAMADDIAGLLDHLGVERATVIGHSLGGVVAYHLAIRHPHRVARLVLEDPPAPLAFDRPPLVEDEADGFDWQMMHQTERQFTRPDPTWRELLTTIRTPTLVVSGGPGSHVRAEQTAELVPGAELVTVDVGHLIHETAPDAFLAAANPFLDC